jgi:hypothetical protein
MATVRIGGKDLDVRPTTLGFIKRKLVPAQNAVDAVESEIAKAEKFIEMILLFVGHNEGVTPEWLEDAIPISGYAQLAKDCAIAGGQKVIEGEAVSQ